jgi:hypothetical protein
VFFVFCLFFFFPYLVLSVAPEEVLAVLFLLHRENGDFSILMKDILEVCLFDGVLVQIRWRVFFCQLFHFLQSWLGPLLKTVDDFYHERLSCFKID